MCQHAFHHSLMCLWVCLHVCEEWGCLGMHVVTPCKNLHTLKTSVTFPVVTHVALKGEGGGGGEWQAAF